MEQKVSLCADVEDEELDMSTEHRKKAEKSGGHKQNFFLRDSKSNSILVVKVHVNIERSYKEWCINRKLNEHKVPHIIPALAWCKGRQTSNSTMECAFLVIPFLRATPLSFVEGLTDLQLLQGLAQMIEIFIVTDDRKLGLNGIGFQHKDLNQGQILYEPSTGNWYLVDFGLSEITYFAPMPGADDAVNVQVKVTLQASSSLSDKNEEFALLVNLFSMSMPII